MIPGLSMASVYLILVGGLSVSVANAAMRREAAWALALGLVLIICTNRSDLPATVIAWGCACYALAAFAWIAATLMRAIGFPVAPGLLGAAVLVGVWSASADARYPGLGGTLLQSPPMLGIRMEGLLRVLLAG